MRKTEKTLSWVVYRMTMKGKGSGMGTVCEEAEWEEMELSQPGYHTLVQAGITNEGIAERLARSVPVDSSQAKPTKGSIRAPLVTKRASSAAAAAALNLKSRK